MSEITPEELEVGQEPRGCRYVFGDPGHGSWCYCQKPMVEGHSLGSIAKPPYCDEHIALIGAPTKPWTFYADWMLAGRIECDPDKGDRAEMPLDLYVSHVLPRAFKKGFSHD